MPIRKKLFIKKEDTPPEIDTNTSNPDRIRSPIFALSHIINKNDFRPITPNSQNQNMETDPNSNQLNESVTERQFTETQVFDTKLSKIIECSSNRSRSDENNNVTTEEQLKNQKNLTAFDLRNILPKARINFQTRTESINQILNDEQLSNSMLKTPTKSASIENLNNEPSIAEKTQKILDRIKADLYGKGQTSSGAISNSVFSSTLPDSREVMINDQYNSKLIYNCPMYLRWKTGPKDNLEFFKNHFLSCTNCKRLMSNREIELIQIDDEESNLLFENKTQISADTSSRYATGKSVHLNLSKSYTMMNQNSNSGKFRIQNYSKKMKDSNQLQPKTYYHTMMDANQFQIDRELAAQRIEHQRQLIESYNEMANQFVNLRQTLNSLLKINAAQFSYEQQQSIANQQMIYQRIPSTYQEFVHGLQQSNLNNIQQQQMVFQNPYLVNSYINVDRIKHAQPSANSNTMQLAKQQLQNSNQTTNSVQMNDSMMTVQMNSMYRANTTKQSNKSSTNTSKVRKSK